MISISETSEARPVWLVGASYGGTDDQSEAFVREGIGQGGNADRYINEVKSIQTGDRFAIKAI